MRVPSRRPSLVLTMYQAQDGFRRSWFAGQLAELLRLVKLTRVVTDLREEIQDRIDPLIEPADVQLGASEPAGRAPPTGPRPARPTSP
jgi:hypothetical protein